MKPRFSVAAILTATLASLFAVPVLANTYNVNVTGDAIIGICDGNHCSLREAIIDANNNPGMDTINLPAGEYLLVIDGTHEDYCAEGDLDIRDDVFIEGEGPDVTIINANRLDRVFHIPVAGLSVSLHEMTITGGGGLSQGGDGGGGILNEGSDLAVMLCDVVDNQTGSIMGVTYYGGGIYSSFDECSLSFSTISNNKATKAGGIYHGAGGALSISYSTISHNVARENYGAIYSRTNDATISNSTIAFNITMQDPNPDIGGIMTSDDMSIFASTINGNEDAAVFCNHVNGGIVTFTNSAVDGPCLGGSYSYATGGGNVFEIPGHFVLGSGDFIVDCLDLAPLGGYGGETETMLPYPFSPLIDHPGADPACFARDQRYRTRPRDGDNDGSVHCDAGAVEYIYDEMLFGDNFEAGNTSRWSSSAP